MLISIFLPVRKGSKRVKNKNFASINNFKYGLLEIKVKQFLKLRKYFKKREIEAEFIVSTDCNITKCFIKNYSWIKIHNRTKKFSKDDCLDLFINAVHNICLGNFILWTHVTSPLFNHFDYIHFLEFFLKSRKNFQSAFSATLIGSYVLNKKYKWISHNMKKKKWPRTQDLSPLYIVNNAAFIANRNVYKICKNRLDSFPLPILSRKGSDLDIDNKHDFDYFKKISRIL